VSGGVCLCAGELTDCGGTCVDTRIAREHCGGCDLACGEDARCVAAECVGGEPDGGPGDGGADAGSRPGISAMSGGWDWGLGGCDCRAAPPSPSRSAALALFVVLAAWAAARRQR
jgi:MYXO-CTERM domain-containing protein